MSLAEFAIIERFFAGADGPGFAHPAIVKGIGDDCALLALQAGEQLAVSMDLLVEQVHFPAQADPFLLGQRSILVNLSDLAAMGARPLGFTLGLSLPKADEVWLDAFSRGLTEVARAQDCPLIGGDTTRGPLTICIQVHGAIPAGVALQRSGARAGDLICVTGTLGDAAAGLALLQGCKPTLKDVERASLLSAFYQPECRIPAGLALRGLASSAIDLSDGLASDLLHILRASSVGARIDLETLPLSEPFCAAITAAEREAVALGGGDDYELCFTLPRGAVEECRSKMAACGVAFSVIGSIEAQTGIRYYRDNVPTGLSFKGYNHFA